MALLTTAELMQAFKAHVSASDRVDISVAWLGQSEALNALLQEIEKRKLQTRIIVGLSGNATNPIALRSLRQSGAQIRIGSCSSGIFHPKFYLFHLPSRSMCWIGSSNLTLAGFAQNSELIHEFTEDGAASQWFEDVWKNLSPDASAMIDGYTQNWKRPPPVPGQQIGPGNLPRGNSGTPLAEIAS